MSPTGRANERLRPVRLTRRGFVRLGAAATLAGAMPWPGATAPLAAAGSGTVRLAGDDPSTLDPALVRDTTASGYAVEIFAGLTRIGPTLEPQGALARDWTVDAGGRLYRFQLRPGLKFHDSTPLSAIDVKRSWERALDPATRSLAAPVFLGDIEGAEDIQAGRTRDLAGARTLGSSRMEVTLTEPVPFFPAKLANGPALVVDRRDIARGPRWFQRPNGSGPYRLAEWDPERRIVLERSDEYVPTTGGPARVEFLQLVGGEELLRYELGEIDFAAIGGPNVERFSDPREPRADELVRTPSLSLQFLGFNTALPPFNETAVRRAFAMAIDRARINRVTLRGNQAEARGVVPPGLAGHRADYPGLGFDPAAARRELARSRSGSAEGLPEIIMTVPGSGLVEGPLVRAIVLPWLTELGVRVSVQQLDFDDFITALDTPEHELQCFMLGWAADVPDAFDFLDVLFRSDRPDNYWHLNDGLVDLWLNRARRSTSEAERLANYAKVETRVVERAVVVPLFFSVDHDLVQPWISGYTGRPIVREWLTDISTSRS